MPDCSIRSTLVRRAALFLVPALAGAASPAAAQRHAQDSIRHRRTICVMPPVRVSGRADEVYVDCQLTHPARWLAPRREPVYPEPFRVAGIEGRVRLQFVVNAQGRVDDGSIRVVQSTHSRFTKAARYALLSWRATVPRRDSVPVPELMVQDFVFALGGPHRCPRIEPRVRQGAVEGDAMLICVPGPVTGVRDTAR
jgi:TonB family protein